jgi:uncharacterized protein
MPRRILSENVFTETLPHQPAEEVVTGQPTIGAMSLGVMGAAEQGIWEITTGTVRDTEVDEIFVVLAGCGTVQFADGEILAVRPGVAVRLHAGERTEWKITERLRKIYLTNVG